MTAANKTRSPITTHVLDVTRGRPAAGLPVQLERRASGGEWLGLARAATNVDGRVEDLLPPGSAIEAGLYRLTFETGAVSTFFPLVQLVFEVKAPGEHYHVPLLLSPFGYSTYRGT